MRTPSSRVGSRRRGGRRRALLVVVLAVIVLVTVAWGNNFFHSDAVVDDLDLPDVSTNGEQSVRAAHTMDLGSRSAIVLHKDTGEIIISHNALDAMPIASLTKIMSAWIALDAIPDIDAETTISSDDWTIGGTLRITPDIDRVTIRDIVYASVTGSANNAANRLARITGMEDKEFVREMNRRAIALGLEEVFFADPSGLSPENTASAYDVAVITAHAFEAHDVIRDAASRASYDIQVRNTGKIHTVSNPNQLFKRSYDRFHASKTGFLNAALYCLMLVRETPHGSFIAVTLGHPDKTAGEEETIALLDAAEEWYNP